MAFGKPGRPAEDRLARQREIYEAVSPLILDTGARRLSMRAAARAACLSVGGLYHYFPTKRELVLHGMQPEAIARYCQDFHDRVGYEANFDSAGYREAYLGFLTGAIGFLRPALYAALELGVETLQSILDATLTAATDEFTAKIRATYPGTPEEAVYQAGRAIHRAILSALLDRTITAEEFRSEAAALIDGYQILKHPAPPAAGSMSSRQLHPAASLSGEAYPAD